MEKIEKSYAERHRNFTYLFFSFLLFFLYPTVMRQTFIVGCMFVATSVLGPIMYNLWIFSGSANANFYFAVTLAFNTAQVMQG